MDSTKTILIALLAVLVGAAGVYMFSQSDDDVGVPGVALYPQSVTTFTQGGGTYSTSSTATTYTLTSTEVLGHGSVEWEADVNTTLTFMASSSFPGIPNPGDSRTMRWQNASSTAASTITFAAGTGIDLQYTEATGGDLVLNGLDWAEFTFIRQSDTDVTVLYNEFTEAD